MKQAVPWTRDQKIALASLIVAVAGIFIALLFPEFRVWLHLEKPRLAASEVAPTIQSGKTEISPKQSTTNSEASQTAIQPLKTKAVPTSPNTPAAVSAAPPAMIAVAPNGIANAAPNFGSQTINNFGPRSRRISQQQHDSIVSILTNQRASVIVWAFSADSDTWGLAEDLYRALKDSGWSMHDSDVQSAIQVEPLSCDVGIFIPGDPSQPVTQLFRVSPPNEVAEALKTVGLTFKLGHSEKLGDAAVKIVVGPR